MITMVIVMVITLAIGSVFHQSTVDDLEAAKSKSSNINLKIPKQIKIFAIRKSQKLMIFASLFLAALYIGMTIYIGADGLFEEVFYYGDIEYLFWLLLPSIVFIPVLSLFSLSIWRVEKAIRSNQILMTIDKNGFECYSKILGKLRKYSWEDVEQFYPATRRQGAVASIIVELKLSGKHNAKYFQDKVGFQTAHIDLDIIKFVQYFEHFSGLKAGALRKTWS